MTSSTQIRMLPREMPRDPVHCEIVRCALDGTLAYSDIPHFFNVPGVGFHMALYTLTMHLIGYRQAGSQTFVVPEGMRDALANTSLEAVGAWDIKFPYEYQYVALPGCDYEIWGGERTGWHKVRGAFVYFKEGEDPRQTYNPTNGLYEPDKPRFPGVPNPGYINIFLWGVENEKSLTPGDDASLYLTINLQEMLALNLDLEGYIQTLLSSDARHKDGRQIVGGAPSRVLREVAPLGVALDVFTDPPSDKNSRLRLSQNTVLTLRVLFNALLYIGSDGAEVETDEETAKADKAREEVAETLKRLKSPSKRKKAERRLDKLPRERVVWVGRSVESRESEVTRTGDPRGPGRRTWVRGHWWPRKDTIRQRIQAAQKAVQELERVLTKSQGELKGAVTPAERAASLNVVLYQEAQLREAQIHQESLSLDLQQKHRWVRPYVRNKDSAEVIGGHTYQLGGRSEGGGEGSERVLLSTGRPT